MVKQWQWQLLLHFDFSVFIWIYQVKTQVAWLI